MLNQINVMGRLTRDPELRYTQNQVPVCSFTIACSRDFGGSNGRRETDYFDCVAWRSVGELVSEYFTTGRMIVVAGHLQNRNWTDKDGNKRRSTEIITENVYFGDSRIRGDSKGSASANDDEGFEAPDDYGPEDGELPF